MAQALVPVNTDVRKRRERLGITQAQLASLSGISDRKLSMIETGATKTVRPHVAQRLEETLGLGVDTIRARLNTLAGENPDVESVTISELEALVRVAKESGGKLGMATIREILHNRRSNPPPPE